MAFYIKPPGGMEKLQNLSVFAKKRLKFLKQVLSCDGSIAFRGLLECADTAEESDCLIEGATKDRISHFLLRLACCQDAEMATFFVKAETELFCYRFANMNSMELTRLFKSTYQFLSRFYRHRAKGKLQMRHWHDQQRHRTSCSDLLRVLQGIFDNGQNWMDIANNYLDGSKLGFIYVPFEYALSLVARRSVVLERGVAKVPYADILKVLAFFFEQLLLDGMVDARHAVQDIAAGDERMVDLFREIRGLYYTGGRITGVEMASEGGLVGSDDIDNLSICFPPCMQHLHRMLRKRHRLSHFSRVQYTLFLKEVGLPVSEAVRFWRKEYSQPVCCHSESVRCTHDWKKDGRRYTYSIRHLYGLEGSRVNYRAHSCRSIQERNIGHGEEGGCPFRHFDDLHLKNIMGCSGIVSEMDQKRIVDLAQQGNCQEACKAFFRKSVAVSLEHLLTSTVPSRDLDNKSDEKDVDFQPCSEKKPRLESEHIPSEEASCSRTLLQDESSDESSSTKQNGSRHLLNKETIPRSLSGSFPQALSQSPSSNEKPLSGGPLVSPSTETLSSKEHLPMPSLSCSADTNADVPRNQLIAILKDVHIQKPADYYRSYNLLLESLQQLGES